MSTCSDTTGHRNSRARERPEPNPQALTIGGTSATVAGSTTTADALSLACRSPISIRASALHVRRGSRCASQPPEMLGKLCGLDALIRGGRHDQPVSALAVMLPRRDEIGLTWSNQRVAIRCGRMNRHRSCRSRELCPLSCTIGAPSLVPSRGGLGRVGQGCSTGRFERLWVEGRAVDHIVLVYYCGDTGQRPCWEEHPRGSRHAPCPDPSRLRGLVARIVYRNRLAGGGKVALLGAAILIVARRGIRPHDWAVASGVRPRKRPDPLESECLERLGPPMAGASEVLAVATRRRAEGGRSAIEDRGLR